MIIQYFGAHFDGGRGIPQKCTGKERDRIPKGLFCLVHNLCFWSIRKVAVFVPKVG